MLDSPLAASSPIRSKIKQMSRRKAKNSRRSVSLLDVSAIDANPDVSSQISESNETLASGYRDSGYVRSEVSSLEEDDGKASKDLVEELKFKDVLICELQESNRGLRMRCADAENKIWRLRVKCQSHCGCCQVKEAAPSPTDSAGEDKSDALPAPKDKYEALNQDLFQFKRTQSFSAPRNDLNLTFGNDRFANAEGRLAVSARLNTSLPAKLLSRSKSSGTIGTQTPAHRSSHRNEDQAEKLFALKVQQWQKELCLNTSQANKSVRQSSFKAADLSHEPLSVLAPLPLPLKTPNRASEHVEADEASLLSIISERDSSLEVDPNRAIIKAFQSPDLSPTDSSMTHSSPFTDITNRRNPACGGKNQSKATLAQHFTTPPFCSDPADVHHVTPKDSAADWASGPPKVDESFANSGPGGDRGHPCGHCCQPSPVIIVPSGCCSCCKSAENRTTSTPDPLQRYEASSETPKELSRLKLDASTDSSDLHPIFEMKSKIPLASGKLNSSAPPESDSKILLETTCGSDHPDRDCKCSSKCSGLTVPLAKRFDAKAEYKRMIEESMKKIASDARAETESLSFQPWTSPDSPEMSPLMKRLAESSHYVNQMAIAINRITSRFHRVTGAPNPVNPSP